MALQLFATCSALQKENLGSDNLSNITEHFQNQGDIREQHTWKI